MTDDANSTIRFKKQRAENEEAFRRANQKLRESVEKLYEEDETHIFLCECSSMDCQERLPITIDEFKTLSGKAGRFAVIPGHEQLDIERIVAQHEGWTVVEKSPALLA